MKIIKKHNANDVSVNIGTDTCLILEGIGLAESFRSALGDSTTEGIVVEIEDDYKNRSIIQIDGSFVIIYQNGNFVINESCLHSKCAHLNISERIWDCYCGIGNNCLNGKCNSYKGSK